MATLRYGDPPLWRPSVMATQPFWRPNRFGDPCCATRPNPIPYTIVVNWVRASSEGTQLALALLLSITEVLGRCAWQGLRPCGLRVAKTVGSPKRRVAITGKHQIFLLKGVGLGGQV